MYITFFIVVNLKNKRGSTWSKYVQTETRRSYKPLKIAVGNIEIEIDEQKFLPESGAPYQIVVKFVKIEIRSTVLIAQQGKMVFSFNVRVLFSGQKGFRYPRQLLFLRPWHAKFWLLCLVSKKFRSSRFMSIIKANFMHIH